MRLGVLCDLCRLNGELLLMLELHFEGDDSFLNLSYERVVFGCPDVCRSITAHGVVAVENRHVEVWPRRRCRARVEADGYMIIVFEQVTSEGGGV